MEKETFEKDIEPTEAETGMENRIRDAEEGEKDDSESEF